MRLVNPILVLIGSSSEAEIGAAVDNIKREGVIPIQQGLHIIPKIISRQALPLLAPMRQPTCVDLPTKDQSTLEILRIHQIFILIEVVAFTEADIGAVPIVLHPVGPSIFIVKIANNA